MMETGYVTQLAGTGPGFRLCYQQWPLPKLSSSMSSAISVQMTNSLPGMNSGSFSALGVLLGLAPPNPVIPCCRACHAAGGNFWSISVFNVYRVCVLLGIFLCFKKASLCIFPSRSPFPSLLRLSRKPVKPPKLLNRQYLVTPESWSHSCFILLTKTQCGSLQEFFFLLLIIASLW